MQRWRNALPISVLRLPAEGELDSDKEGEASPASQPGCDSPIRSILASSSFLALTQEQQQKLELLELDYCAEVARLSSERLLLELEARRFMLTSRLGGRRRAALTVESLAAIDAVTINLRQAWVRAYEQANALLSSDQSERVATRLGNPPNFVDLNVGNDAGLNARIADAISARLKDTKVVEIETAQAIVERTIGWAKSAALVMGVPLALLVVVLAILGLNSWRDFREIVSKARTDVEAQIKDAGETVSGVSAEATKLRSSYEQLQQQIGDIPTLASNLQLLAGRVGTLEEKVKWNTPKGFSEETQQRVEQQVAGFRRYLESLGYIPASSSLEVEVDANEKMNAYYTGDKLVVGLDTVDMPDVIYHEYSMRMLKDTNPPSWDASAWELPAILEGLADYFACSYLGNPKVSPALAAAIRQVAPDAVGPDALRDLTNKRRFATASDPASAPYPKPSTEANAAGESWGGAAWDVRTMLGCKADVAQCAVADRVVLASWRNLSVEPKATIARRFAQLVVDNVRTALGPDQANKAGDIFRARGLELPR